MIQLFRQSNQMLRLISVKLPQQLRRRPSSICNGHLYSDSSLKPISDPPNSTDPKSLTVSFLRNSCGLSLELATSASKKLTIENVENPNSVLNLLRTHDLTQNHIIHLISSRPLLLSADLGNTLKPNMELFKSLGFSGANLAKMLTKYPTVLESDAYTAVEFFRAHGFSDMQIKTLTMKFPPLFTYNAQKILQPKLEFFKSLGFSDLEITKLLSEEPYILKSSLEKQIIPCIQELRRFLGTDENVLKAIRKCYGLLRADLLGEADYSEVFSSASFDVEGINQGEYGIPYMVAMAEKKFMVKFVSKYQNEVPDVVSAHQGKIEFQGLPIAMKM
ncbi:uncharacterized protein LOC118349427 [Juglans regia]|uniref:Uncharacterized protein LOC118349427 n=1 Tax=Juglans regia TaxID=51240 RepID=A0A6P9ER47_JUGRE|nr:uncharacterized protein LOC118349427 [Juglans regia]